MGPFAAVAIRRSIRRRCRCNAARSADFRPGKIETEPPPALLFGFERLRPLRAWSLTRRIFD